MRRLAALMLALAIAIMPMSALAGEAETLEQAQPSESSSPEQSEETAAEPALELTSLKLSDSVKVTATAKAENVRENGRVGFIYKPKGGEKTLVEAKLGKDGSFSTTISLKKGTKYTFYACYADSETQLVTKGKSITTGIPGGKVSVKAPQLLAYNKVKLTGSVANAEDIAERGFVYAIEGGKGKKVAASGKANGSYTAEVTLSANKSYTVYAYYKDSEGNKFKSEVKKFKTEKKTWLPTSDNKARYQYLFGTGVKYFTRSTAPAGYRNASEANANMTTVTVPVWKLSGGKKYASKYTFRINKKLKNSIVDIFNEIYALKIKFPVQDLAGYSYRTVGGVGLDGNPLLSAHAFGAAIDINISHNDYYVGKGNDLRDKSDPYYIPKSVIKIFEKHGWLWGGNFEICADTMHFQYLGLEMLQYHKNPPFTTLKYNAKSPMKNSDVRMFQQRMNYIGYNVGAADGVYDKTCCEQAKKFQRRHGLKADGIVGMATWTKLCNESHLING